MESQSTENVRSILAGFEDVWRRVGVPPPNGHMPGPPKPVPADTCGTLAHLAADAARLAAWDRALARRLTGADQSRLLALAEERRKMHRRLAAEHFLLCGERLILASAPALPRDTLDALRSSMQADEAAAVSLGAAAAHSPPPLAALLREYAGSCRAAAGEKRMLILRAYR